MHGGASPRGAKSPHFSHGRRSIELREQDRQAELVAMRRAVEWLDEYKSNPTQVGARLFHEAVQELNALRKSHRARTRAVPPSTPARVLSKQSTTSPQVVTAPSLPDGQSPPVPHSVRESRKESPK